MVYSLMYPKWYILILKFMFVTVALKAQKRIAPGLWSGCPFFNVVTG